MTDSLTIPHCGVLLDDRVDYRLTAKAAMEIIWGSGAQMPGIQLSRPVQDAGWLLT